MLPFVKTRRENIERLYALLATRILVLDGATGTALQARNLTASDFGGPALEGCNENLVFTRPDVIRGVHEQYLAAGCDIIETNTFGSTPLVLAEYDLGHLAYEQNKCAATLAREAADKFAAAEKPRFVAGSIGPTTKAISVTGGVTFDELVQNFYEQARGLMDGGVDYLLFETCQDTRNIKAGFLGVKKLFAERGERLPVAVSGTIEPMGTMLAGQGVDALVAALAHEDLLYLGLNCATGPEFMTDHIRSLSELCPFPVACVPNAGLPDENGHYLESPAMMCQVLDRFVTSGWVNLIGGCCGTECGHIASFAKLVAGKAPRAHRGTPRSHLSGTEYLEVTDALRPVIVGERTNVIGSKKFKTLICEEKFDEATEVARAQVKNGAQIIDVCLANPDRDELKDMQAFMDLVVKKIKVPIMIDSTDAKVLESALTYCQGKAIINSINLEDGEERFEHVVPLAKNFGAALVVGCIDEDPVQGMGVTAKRKLEIARRSYDLLTRKYGVLAEDIYWDALVFPCGTGDAQYVGSAAETIEGIRAIKQEFPRTRTVLGVSNVSFGLPNAGREVLNSVFLYHAVQAGLDLAIVNSEKLERYASIPEEEKKLAYNLLYNIGDNCLADFAAHFRTKKRVKKDPTTIPLDERLAGYIIEGSKEGLHDDLALALRERAPLEIINGPLMKGMDEVGRLFNANKLIVAEVLQSAESMKAAVAYLEPFLEKSETSSRGKVLLATVKGDVHDIGKNLVEIILANNGFQVVNLGIKVPSDVLIRAVQEHAPQIIGLSGLLVKSAQQMVATADDFSRAGIHTPILVGGAALSANFVDKQIAKAYSTGTVAYASDAMAGLDLAKQIVDPDRFETLKKTLEEARARKAAAGDAVAKPKASLVDTRRSEKVARAENIPPAPDLERHVWLSTPPIEQIWNYINPMMLYGRHLGMKNTVVRLLTELGSSGGAALRHKIEAEDKKALAVWDAVEEVKSEFRGTDYLRPSAVWQFFLSTSEGNTLRLWDPSGVRERVSFEFPRQAPQASGGGRLCLADYVDGDLSRQDNTAVFLVSVGRQIRELSERFKNEGQYLKSHIIQALALESAEALAEYLHSQIRRLWGFGDLPAMTMLERFQARYRGKRYSFGYPACPDLSHQQKLFQLLSPTEIGVSLTEGDMMEPEASVSALVFHHPGASYFSVGEVEGA